MHSKPIHYLSSVPFLCSGATFTQAVTVNDVRAGNGFPKTVAYRGGDKVENSNRESRPIAVKKEKDTGTYVNVITYGRSNQTLK